MNFVSSMACCVSARFSKQESHMKSTRFVMIAGLGYCMILVSGMACIYYNAVLSWIIYYLYSSFTSTLPWASCGHWWNTPTCFDHGQITAPSCDNSSALSGNGSTPLGNGSFCDGSDAFYREINGSRLNFSMVTMSNASQNIVTADGLAPKSAAEEFWQ